MTEKQTSDGWFANGIEVIPFGARLDAVARFIGGLIIYHHKPDNEPAETGAEHMLQQRLFEENISGYGYDYGED